MTSDFTGSETDLEEHAIVLDADWQSAHAADVEELNDGDIKEHYKNIFFHDEDDTENSDFEDDHADILKDANVMRDIERNPGED